MKYLLLCLVALSGSAFADEIQIDLITEYVNPVKEILMMPTDVIIFHAPTCSRYDNYDVTVKIDLPHNPLLDHNKGLVFFAASNKLVNDTVKPDDVICSMQDVDNYTTTCTGRNTKGDIYIYVHSNNRPAVNFAVTLTFSQPTSNTIPVKKAQRAFPLVPNAVPTVVELSQVFNYQPPISLPYGNATLIHIKICPSAGTGKQYYFSSMFQAIDPVGESVIAQAICHVAYCDFDHNVIAKNIFDLPVNIVKSSPISYSDLWVYAVAFSGPQDKTGYPIGRFKFAAVLSNN